MCRSLSSQRRARVCRERRGRGEREGEIHATSRGKNSATIPDSVEERGLSEEVMMAMDTGELLTMGDMTEAELAV